MATLHTLLVEDSGINAKIIQGFLDEGQTDTYDVVNAGTLADAVSAAQTQRFDVILLDLTLPDSDDMDTLDTIRAQDLDAAIIVLTASADTATAKEALRHGCQDFLIKGSFEGNLLRHAIRYAVERKKMENELRESERRFQDFAAAGADWFWEMGPDLKFTYLSDEFEDITGFRRDDYLGHAYAIISATEQTSPAWTRYQKNLQERKPIHNFEYIAAVEPGGGAQWFRVNGLPVYDKAGAFQGYRGTGADISIAKYDQTQVQRGKDLVDGVLSTSLDGIIVLQAIRNNHGDVMDFSFSHVNRRAEEILGRDRQELMGRLFRLEMPHMVSQRVLQHIIHTLESGNAFDIEQHYDEKGMHGWVRIVGVQLGDGVVMTLSDVSARKEAEREQRMATALFRTTADAMMITDADNKIISANPSFTMITGYDVDEVIGLNPRFLASGRHPDAFYKEMWVSLNEVGHWFGEVWNRRKNGEVYVQRATISVIRNEKGDVENYVAVFNDATEQKKREEQLYQRANYDALTGLPNRTLLEDRIATAIPKAQRDGNELGVMFIDLDGFKPVNDVHGHLAGDFVLQEIAKRFTNCVRESDTVARLGGDEFVIMTQGVNCRANVEEVASHILEALKDPFVYEGKELWLGCSIGIALYPDDSAHPVELIERADKAMYGAKNSGKGRFVFYS